MGGSVTTPPSLWWIDLSLHCSGCLWNPVWHLCSPLCGDIVLRCLNYKAVVDTIKLSKMCVILFIGFVFKGVKFLSVGWNVAPPPPPLQWRCHHRGRGRSFEVLLVLPMACCMTCQQFFGIFDIFFQGFLVCGSMQNMQCWKSICAFLEALPCNQN